MSLDGADESARKVEGPLLGAVQEASGPAPRQERRVRRDERVEVLAVLVLRPDGQFVREPTGAEVEGGAGPHAIATNRSDVAQDDVAGFGESLAQPPRHRNGNRVADELPAEAALPHGLGRLRPAAGKALKPLGIFDR